MVKNSIQEEIKVYDQVIEKMEEWPINKLSEDREQFVKELEAFMLNRYMRQDVDKISDLIAQTIYQERIRIKEEPWKVDPPNEMQFWRKIQTQLVKKSLDREEEEAKAANKVILEKIIHRYSEEIVGTFNIKTFLFARRFLTAFFNRLLNAAASRNFKRLFNTKHHITQSFQCFGEIETIRKLVNKGTLVVVPTHFSNLDSIVVGYAMDAILGLPSFSWGAGLNLYNSGIVAYYLNRMGTYRVDRRKKNPIYLETLKAMSNLSIQRGTNSLFFPGGTRSRSGKMEDRLKKGMLGTAVEAQRSISESGKDNKVFIVPIVISYHFCLEAKFLIQQHLKKIGKEHFLQNRDASYSRRKTFKFIWELFSESSDVVLSFGKPLDVLGNFVDEEGRSFDEKGKEINVNEYFWTDGVVKKDLQREMEYTNILADKIVERYKCENIVLTSHLVAFVTFNLLRAHNQKLDLFGLLRLPPEDYVFIESELQSAVRKLRDILLNMEANGQLKLSSEVKGDINDLVKDGIKRLGSYHAKKPIKYNKAGKIVSQDFNVLYFYHNRLDSYGLDKLVNWSEFNIETAE